MYLYRLRPCVTRLLGTLLRSEPVICNYQKVTTITKTKGFRYSTRVSSMIPSIAIVGAGPGGLTLASLLHQAKIPFTIFDLRSGPVTSAISGSLDLHTESGLRALQAAGLYGEFQQLTRPNSEDMIITDKTGRVCFSENSGGLGEQRPEIDRTLLTDLLISSFPSDLIKWNHKVRSIEPSLQNRWTINFESHEAQTFDLVIGADGAWSRVRRVLTDVEPQYSGVHCITFVIPSIYTNPAVRKTLGEGKLFALGDGKAIIAQRGSTESVCIYAMLTSPSASYLSFSDLPLDSLPLPALKQKLVSDPEYFGDWSTELKAIIAAASGYVEHYVRPKPLYMLPIGPTWTSKPGVTLLGDAAHLMTPFAGEGVNVAMLDALELAERIIEAHKTAPMNGLAWEQVTQTYEKDMFPRAEEKMRDTFGNMEMLFAVDAAQGFVDMMNSHGPPADKPV
jgi:2-polyprenyl-6-methoxyphenol hydroxylase-like FAD-dependent oxidoreductase